MIFFQIDFILYSIFVRFSSRESCASILEWKPNKAMSVCIGQKNSTLLLYFSQLFAGRTLTCRRAFALQDAVTMAKPERTTWSVQVPARRTGCRHEVNWRSVGFFGGGRNWLYCNRVLRGAVVEDRIGLDSGWSELTEDACSSMLGRLACCV